MRLAKYLAHAGVASRRAAEEIVRQGRVTVGGRVVRDPALDVGGDGGEGSKGPGGSDGEVVVAVDGKPLAGPEPRVVYAVNKPIGVLSTVSDPYGRPTVVSLVPAHGLRLYPVGRLDGDSDGLILLTNDGELAHRLTHPSFEVSKTYRVTVVGGPVGRSALTALREGVELEDGPTAPAEVRRIGLDGLEITIHEGRNRQVRRMCEAVGHPVVSLRRIAFGPLRLGDLAPGAHRTLSPREIHRLRDCSRTHMTSGEESAGML